MLFRLPLAAFVAAATISPAPPPTSHHLTPKQAHLRAVVYRSHPCLAWIVDREDGSWDPTVSFGGGHNVNDSYGLGQANPGTKMAKYGADWRTNPWTQMRWMVAYAQKYGGECQSKVFWQSHNYW